MSIINEALKKAQKFPLTQKSQSKLEKSEKPRAKTKAKSLFFNAIPISVFLFILLASSLFYFLSRRSIKDYPVQEEAITVEDKSAEPVYIKQPIEEKKEYLSSAPSLSSSYKAVQNRKSIDLNGIMYTPQRPLAIINNNIMAEGDTVGEFKILKIDRDFVKFGLEEEEFIVRLKR